MLTDLIESFLNRIDDDAESNTMGLMTRDDDDDCINWENTPFTPPPGLRGKAGGPIEHYAERGASRLYEELTATRDGQLTEVRTGWFDVGSMTGYTPRGLYFYEVAPLAATAPGVTWNAAFTMDLDDAPAFRSDAWEDMASEFQLTETEAEKGVESMVMCAYNALEDLTRRNDGDRAVHPKELRSHGPHIKDRYFELAMTCLAECDGVNGPNDDAPAWSYTDPKGVDVESDASDTEETTA